MIYGSICSGIEAATVAWEPLGWEPAFFAEIDQFPSAVLEHHFPGVPNHGDFTTIGVDDYGTIRLLVGGTPCQDYSIAGKREGMDGERGSLTLEFVRLLERKRPVWFLWENVPGILSSNGGRDFGTFFRDLAIGRPKYKDQICPDGHRYKAIGNSMAVPVMRWLGERIQMVDDMIGGNNV